MTERIPCKTEGCKATILPTTAAKTGGYCMPCHQEQERQKRQAYIEKHRRTVDLYEGLTDPVDILKIMHAPKQYDPLIQHVPYPLSKEQLYVTLTADQASRMLSFAEDLLKEDDTEKTDIAENILLSQVCYRNDNIAGVLPKFLEKGIYHPAILFKDAPSEIRDRLIQQVEWDDDNRNHILLILGWIGDSEVVARFRKWRSNPPKWVDKLYVTPEIYALDAGWELTSDGGRRDLIHGMNYAIEKAKEPKQSHAEAHKALFLKSSISTCPWCSGKLITLIDVEANHPSLAYLNLKTQRLRVETCERCGCFGTIYMDLDREGVPTWSRFNREPDYLRNFDEDDYGYDATEWNLTLSDEPRSPFYAANWALSQPDSQIGGHPSWVQDAEYPECPCCHKRMRFVGQVDWADFDNYGEGIFYMFLCPEDTITATLYQQS